MSISRTTHIFLVLAMLIGVSAYSTSTQDIGQALYNTMKRSCDGGMWRGCETHSNDLSR